MLHMIVECVRECVFAMDPTFRDRQLDGELRNLLNGGMQRVWRMTLDPQQREGIAAFLGRLPLLSALAEQLLATPASAASVERSFSAHARCHTDSRASMSEGSVETQLALHSFLRPLSAAPQPHTRLPSKTNVGDVLGWCFPAWSAPRRERLREHDAVVVFLMQNNALRPFSGTLLKKQDNGHWTIRWGGPQLFSPAEDFWMLQGETATAFLAPIPEE